MNPRLLFAAMMLFMIHELSATTVIQNYTPFDIAVRFKAIQSKQIAANLSPNGEYQIDVPFSVVMISGIKTSANTFWGGDEKEVVLAKSGDQPNVYYVTCEFATEKNGLTDPLKPQKIRFFLVGAVNFLFKGGQVSGGVYDTSAWFSGVTGLAEKRVSQNAREDRNVWCVRNRTPFTVNVQFLIQNAAGLKEMRSAVIEPNSEYKKEDKTIQVESIEVNGIKTIGANNYFGGGQEAIILNQKVSVDSKSVGTLWACSKTWDIFAQFIDKATPGLPLLVNPTKVRFVLAYDQKGGKVCQSSSIINVSPWYDAKTGLR